MLIKIREEMGVPEVQELVIENEIKEFKITTEVEKIDGVKGGKISGEDSNTYEKVKYNGESKKQILITPDEGYELVKVTENGVIKEFKDFTKSEDNKSYIYPQLTGVKENKHIVVTFAKTDEKFVINKTDEKGNPLAGAEFKIEQIEEREEPEGVIESIQDNGQEYPVVDMANEVEGKLGEKRNGNTGYSFVYNEDSKTYEPTNSKTYQEAHNGTGNKKNTTAHSYFEINLSEYEGKDLVVVINARASSENADSGYATITNTTSMPALQSSNTEANGQFMRISGNIGDANYTSKVLKGGNTYYLHIGYKKDVSSDQNEDRIVINSIKLYEATSITYDFTKELPYTSNNKESNTVANSYIPINLRGKTGKYNITVNAQISSESGDYGYATITENKDRVEYNENTAEKQRFIYITEKQEPTNYTIVVEGGRKYYLHLGYYKDGNTNNTAGIEDVFTVNSIEVTLNGSELYVNEAVTTDEKGQAFLNLLQGKYNITEKKAPKGYEISNPSIMCDTAKDHEVTIKNTKRPKLIVHHYVKGTDTEEQEPTKVAEDEEYMGSSIVKEGKYEEYETKPKMNLDRYELDYELQADGQKEYKMPEKWKGTYAPENLDEDGNIVVTYYYINRKIPLTVHHYIEGTTNRVPLVNGGEASDVKTEGDENTTYETQMLTEDQIDERYELVEGQQNVTATFTYPEVEVIYYYKPVERELIINKYAEDGETPLEGAKFEIREKTEEMNDIAEKEAEKTDGSVAEEDNIYITDEKGKISVKLPVGTYEIIEKDAPEGYQIKEGVIQDVTITRKTQEVTEVDVINEKYVAEVIVNHYIYDKKAENPHTTEKVLLSNGKPAEEKIITGHIGDIYGTRALEDLLEGCELYEEPENSSGEMKKETTYVNYYYLSNAVINENTITKDGTQVITSKDEEVHYKIKYTAQIRNYEGKATVTITDTLPYNLDQEKMKNMVGVDSSQNDWLQKALDGGTYDDTAKTITWIETYNNINTEEEETKEKEITIEKDITVIFKNIPTTQTSTEFTNTVQGEMQLEATEQTIHTEEVTHTTTTKFVKDVKVTKKWEHGANIYERPSKVKVVLKKGTEQVGQQVLDAANNWTYTFEGLPKYDESTGEEIEYIVEEQEIEGQSLDYYRRK